MVAERGLSSAMASQSATEVPVPESSFGDNDLEMIKQQLADIAQKDSAIGAVIKMLEKLQQKVDGYGMGSVVEKGNGKVALIQQKGLDYVSKFDGRPEEYDEWRASLFGFLGVDEWITEMLKWAEGQVKDVNKDMLEDYGNEHGVPAVRISKQLHTILLAKTEKDPRSLADNVDDNNGVRAWQRIAELFGKVHPRARRRLLEMLLRPKQAKSYEDVVHHQELWEKVLRKYQSTTKIPLPDDVLVVGYMALLPTHLQESIMGLREEMSTFQEIRDYVNSQVRARRNEKDMTFNLDHVGDHNHNHYHHHHYGESESMKNEPPGNPDDMPNKVLQILNMNQTDENRWNVMAMIQKGQGKGAKGDAKNGDQFVQEKWCRYCQKPGHLYRECRFVDELFKQWREQGGQHSYGQAQFGKGKGKSKGGIQFGQYLGKGGTPKGWSKGPGKGGQKAGNPVHALTEALFHVGKAQQWSEPTQMTQYGGDEQIVFNLEVKDRRQPLDIRKGRPKTHKSGVTTSNRYEVLAKLEAQEEDFNESEGSTKLDLDEYPALNATMRTSEPKRKMSKMMKKDCKTVNLSQMERQVTNEQTRNQEDVSVKEKVYGTMYDDMQEKTNVEQIIHEVMPLLISEETQSDIMALK